MFVDDIYFTCFIAFFSGILGGAHCIGMCGGIIVILTATLPKTSKYKMYFYYFCYNIGRVFTYSLIGFFAGLIGFVIFDFNHNNIFLIVKTVGGVSLICIGLYLAGFLPIFILLEKIGWFFWLRISMYIKRFVPINNSLHALIFGFFWGHMPCGLVYATLIWSLSFGSFVKSSLLMFVFGLGTMPVMFLSIIFMPYIKIIFHDRVIKYLICFVMIILGVLTIVDAIIYTKCH